jgi:hypothetical protein
MLELEELGKIPNNKKYKKEILSKRQLDNKVEATLISY